MTRLSLLPHRSATIGVDASPWFPSIDGADVTADRVAALWDRSTPLALRADVVVRPTEIRQQCGLDPAAPLVLVASWYARGTNLRRVAARVPLDRAAAHHLSCTIDATDAAGDLELDRRVVLARHHPGSDPSVASRAGAILWREAPADRLVLKLDAPTDHLSIEAIDFATRADLDPGAAWAVEVASRDLDADGRSALRLVVNASHPALADLVGRDGARRELVASVLRWDVARRVLDELLTDERFAARFGDLVPGSIGGLAQSLIEQRWPDDTAATLRERRAVSRAAFDAEVQARFGLWGSTPT